jgi:hypothetical protein
MLASLKEEGLGIVCSMVLKLGHQLQKKIQIKNKFKYWDKDRVLEYYKLVNQIVNLVCNPLKR